MNIGTLIKTVRSSRGLSQKEFSEEVGISTNFLCLVERGKRNLSADKIEKVASTLGVSKEALEFVCTNVPKELDTESSKTYLNLQNNIAALLIFQDRQIA
jgi:transcriptional regulator with XRE-family HTH domain